MEYQTIYHSNNGKYVKSQRGTVHKIIVKPDNCVVWGLGLLHFCTKGLISNQMLGQKMLLVQMSSEIYSKLIKNQNLFASLGCGVGN